MKKCASLTKKIADTFYRRLHSGGTIHIEEIQDQVELELMRTGEYKVPKLMYFIAKNDAAHANSNKQEAENTKSATVCMSPCQMATLNRLIWIVLRNQVQHACAGLTRCFSRI